MGDQIYKIKKKMFIGLNFIKQNNTLSEKLNFRIIQHGLVDTNYFRLVHMYCKHQILFAATLFHGLLSIKWFAKTNVHDQALSGAVLLYQPFVIGPRREIFATARFSVTTRKFLASELKLVYSGSQIYLKISEIISFAISYLQ